MTKSDEIAILRDTVQRLGPNSYCGPWLADQLQQIEADMRSDLSPQPSWRESRQRLDREWADMKSCVKVLEETVAGECARRLKAADDEIRAQFARARSVLRDCADKLER